MVWLNCKQKDSLARVTNIASKIIGRPQSNLAEVYISRCVVKADSVTLITKYEILRLRHFRWHVFCQDSKKFWFYKTNTFGIWHLPLRGRSLLKDVKVPFIWQRNVQFQNGFHVINFEVLSFQIIYDYYNMWYEKSKLIQCSCQSSCYDVCFEVP